MVRPSGEDTVAGWPTLTLPEAVPWRPTLGRIGQRDRANGRSGTHRTGCANGFALRTRPKALRGTFPSAAGAYALNRAPMRDGRGAGDSLRLHHGSRRFGHEEHRSVRWRFVCAGCLGGRRPRGLGLRPARLRLRAGAGRLRKSMLLPSRLDRAHRRPHPRAQGVLHHCVRAALCDLRVAVRGLRTVRVPAVPMWADQAAVPLRLLPARVPDLPLKRLKGEALLARRPNGSASRANRTLRGSAVRVFARDREKVPNLPGAVRLYRRHRNGTALRQRCMHELVTYR